MGDAYDSSSPLGIRYLSGSPVHIDINELFVQMSAEFHGRVYVPSSKRNQTAKPPSETQPQKKIQSKKVRKRKTTKQRTLK
jgi:hypothetical protein